MQICVLGELAVPRPEKARSQRSVAATPTRALDAVDAATTLIRGRFGARASNDNTLSPQDQS